MHDTVVLEKSGTPTVMVATSEFAAEAEAQRVALGMAPLRLAIIPHPLSTLTEDEILQRAELVATQAIPIWLGRAEQ